MTPLKLSSTPRKNESNKHPASWNVWKIVALTSSFLLVFNLLYDSTSTAVNQTNIVKRSLLDNDKQAVSPRFIEEQLKQPLRDAVSVRNESNRPARHPSAAPRPCPTEWLPHKLVPIVKEACRRRSKVNGNIFITTFQGDETGLVNWLTALDRLGIDEWLVICMSDHASQQLDRWNIPHIHFEGTGEPEKVLKERKSRYYDLLKDWYQGEELEKRVFLKMLWNQRIRIIHALLASGTTVTHCDYDAVLQKDPRPFTDFLLEEYDIVASQDDWPFPRYDNFGKDIGTSIQMGYVTFKASQRMKTLFQTRVFHQVNKMGDDQEAVNVALWRDGARQITNVTQEKWSGVKRIVETTFSGIKVYYVPEEMFARHCGLKDKAVLQNATMCHCKKDAEESGIPKDVANKYGYWFLEEQEEKRLLSLK